MITIQSTEEERYKELKDRKLTVVPWDSSKSMILNDPNESVAKAVRRTAEELKAVGICVQLEGISEKVKITNATIKESINSMTKQRSNLNNLFKLITVIQPVIQNAVLIDVEKFRHLSKTQKSQIVKGEFQYISAFCDKDFLYPVKITAEQRHQSKDSNIHLVITVGTISMSELKKEKPSIPGVHLHEGKESLDSGRNSSFNISISSLVKYFNKDEAILIKNLPDGLLSKNQKDLKNKLIRFDKEKDLKKQLNIFTDEIKTAAERGDDLVYKIVPHKYSEQMRQAMIQSGICHMPFTDSNGYLNIVVQEKDKNSFLKIQESVFEQQIKIVEKKHVQQDALQTQNFDDVDLD